MTSLDPNLTFKPAFCVVLIILTTYLLSFFSWTHLFLMKCTLLSFSLLCVFIRFAQLDFNRIQHLFLSPVYLAFLALEMKHS